MLLKQSLIAKVALGQYSGPINMCSGKAVSVKPLLKIFNEMGKEHLLRFGARQNNPHDLVTLLVCQHW